MTKRTASSHTALMAAIPLPADGAEGAPEWVHLLPAPADGLVRTSDSRGPYRLGDAAEIIAASFAATDQLEIDVNHSTFLAAPRGERADAMGWIREMQARNDGIWGRVEWNAEGAALVAGKAYRGISPVIIHDAAKKILRIANASLVNRPNLRGLTALNFEQETDMNLLQKLAELLGLDAGATEEQICAAVEAMKGKASDAAPALQSALTEIGTALGATAFTQADVLAAARAAKGVQPAELAALQAEITTLTGQLNAVTEGQARTRAEAYVDAEIRKGRNGLVPSRDRFIAMHMADPANAEAIISGLGITQGGRIVPQATPPKDGEISLQAEQQTAARLIGIDPKAYAETLRAEARTQETL